MSGEIHEISKAIGALQAQIGHLLQVQGAADQRSLEHRREIMEKLTTVEKTVTKRLEEVEKKATALEEFRNRIVGVVVTIAGLATAAWSVLGDLLTSTIRRTFG
jgi:flagellar motility protein MotE (MotC chaperone)